MEVIEVKHILSSSMNMLLNNYQEKNARDDSASTISKPF